MTLHVEFVVPQGALWSGEAERVIAKTLDGDIGILTGHTPVLGILAAGSLVRIKPEDSAEEIQAAVFGGFLSVADDRVSILARQGQLAGGVDRAAAQSALEEAQAQAERESDGAETDAVRYAQALLRVAGERS